MKNLFSFLTKESIKNVDNAVLKQPTNYPPIIEEIHNEFATAGEKLLAESLLILKECEAVDKGKGLSLLNLGFKNVPEAKIVDKTITTEKNQRAISEMILEYRAKYPGYKFITEEIVRKICLKYNLVLGDVSLYKGFVPAKNIKHIEEFNKKITIPPFASLYRNNQMSSESFICDMVLKNPTVDKTRGHHVIEDENGFRAQQEFMQADGIHYYGSINKVGFCYVKIQSEQLLICAPIKDMNTEGMNLKGYELLKHIPDPIILKPICGGYLIVTAWGDEASDPEVINHIDN